MSLGAGNVERACAAGHRLVNTARSNFESSNSNLKMDERVYREYLRSIQEKLDAKEINLLKSMDNLQKRGVKIPDNLPDLSANRLPPITTTQQVEVEEEECAAVQVNDVTYEDEPVDFKEMKEPVLDESEMKSAVYRMMVEAHEKGVPFAMPKLSKTSAVATCKKPPLNTPTPDRFQVKTVQHLFRSPVCTNFYDRFDLKSASPDLKMEMYMKERRALAATPQLSAQTMNLMKEAQLVASKSDVVSTPIRSLFKSPEEPQLECLHLMEEQQKMSVLLNAPESPELSEHVC